MRVRALGRALQLEAAEAASPLLRHEVAFVLGQLQHPASLGIFGGFVTTTRRARDREARGRRGRGRARGLLHGALARSY